MNWVLLIIVLIFVITGAIILYLKKVPHGWVQWRSGVVLKFLPPLDSLPVIELRQSLEDFVRKQYPKIISSLPVHEITDVEIPTRHGQIGARIFNENGTDPSHNIIFIHGGGWCVGSVDTYEESCRRLARQTRLPVISLDYSLAPEFKFPHAHEECLDAVAWISKNSPQLGLNHLPLALIGDSAGGNLIISTMYDSAPEVRSTIKKMIPVYPAVDSLNSDYYSNKAFAKGYYLTKKSMSQFTEGLINHREDLNDLRLSPINQPAMHPLPETFIITAEFDPIRDQGEAYASKLKQEGNSVLLKRYPETIHAFFGLKGFGSRGIEAIDDINRFLSDQSIGGLSEL